LRNIQQNAFNEIKETFRDAEDLFLLKKGLKFGINIDVSNTRLGTRLFQFDDGEPDSHYTIAYAQ